MNKREIQRRLDQMHKHSANVFLADAAMKLLEGINPAEEHLKEGVMEALRTLREIIRDEQELADTMAAELARDISN